MFLINLMKRKNTVTVVTMLLACMLFAVPLFAREIVKKAPVANYQVVDLSADSTDDSNVVDISGGIKNYSFAEISGHAVIYLLDGNDAVVHAVDTEVNDNSSFRHGQVGHFSETVNISNLGKLQSVSVEFVANKF